MLQNPRAKLELVVVPENAFWQYASETARPGAVLRECDNNDPIIPSPVSHAPKSSADQSPPRLVPRGGGNLARGAELRGSEGREEGRGGVREGEERHAEEENLHDRSVGLRRCRESHPWMPFSASEADQIEDVA